MGSRYQNEESFADYDLYRARPKQAPTYGSAQPTSYAPVRPSAHYPPSYGVRPTGTDAGYERGGYNVTPPRQGGGPPLGSDRGHYTTTLPSQGGGPPLASHRGGYTTILPRQGGGPPLGSDSGGYTMTPPRQGGGPPLGSDRGGYTMTPPSQGGVPPLPYSVTDNLEPTRPAPGRGQPRPSLPFESQEPRPQSARPESGYARGGNPPSYGGRHGVGVSEPGYGRGRGSSYDDAPYDAGRRPVPVGLGDPGHVRPARPGYEEEIGLPGSRAPLGRGRGGRLPLSEESHGYGRGYGGSDGYRQPVTEFDDHYDAPPPPISSEYAHQNYVSVFTDPVYGGAVQYNPEGGFSEEPDHYRQMHYKEDVQRQNDQFDVYN